MNPVEQEYLVPFKEISIKCCKCYGGYWKLLRKEQNQKDYFKFDNSIEKVKSFCRYFSDDGILFHFCINCFNIVMSSVPISVVMFEINHKKRGGCVANVLLGNESIDKVCNGCINFVVERFSSDSFLTV